MPQKKTLAPKEGDQITFPDFELEVIETRTYSDQTDYGLAVAHKGKYEWGGGTVYMSLEQAEKGKVEEAGFLRNYWARIVKNREGSVVVDGVHYYAEPGKGNGYGGRTFWLRNLQTGEVTKSENFWRQGPIPDFARGYLPDTHEFVEEVSA